jgi:hypothetical protein
MSLLKKIISVHCGEGGVGSDDAFKLETTAMG